MEIQQHDGVVVEVAGSRQGFAKLLREGEVLQGEREAPGAVVLLPSLPPLYIGPLGGGAPALDPIYKGGGGQGGSLPPKASGAPPPLGSLTLGAGGGPWGAPQPTMGWFPSHFSPWGPPGQVAPPGGPPGPFRWSRYNTGDPRNFPGGRNLTSYI